MSAPVFLRIAVPSPLRRSFDYLPPKAVNIDTLRPGQRVCIPFGRREQIGVILAISHESDIAPERLRHVKAVLDETPVLPEELLGLL